MKLVTTADGRVTIDLARGLVWVGGEIVHLTPYEFYVLAALVRRAGEVVPREELVAEVWGPTGKPHYLKLYIRQLRRKLEEDPRKPRYILTVWGIGYMFRP